MALIKSVNGKSPQIGEDVYLAENATVVGDVVMGNQCSIWFNAVIRGDVHYIRIGNKVNIQDGAVIHCTYQKHPTEIGDNVSIGHNALVHGCKVMNNVLIGMGAIVMDGVRVHSNSIIAASYQIVLVLYHHGTTSLMRSKEDANDYRYFPEPDLQPITINQEYIETVKKSLPPLPKELFKKYTTEFGLSEYDSNVLIEEKEIALYFNELCKYTNNYKGAANFMNGVVKSYLNENAIEIGQFEMSPERLAELVKLVDEGKVSNSVATQKVFGEMLKSDLSAEEIAKTNNWIQESDTNALQDFVQQALEKYPEKVEEYKNGKKGLIGLFMGEVMKLSRGKADPKIANKLVREALEK